MYIYIYIRLKFNVYIYIYIRLKFNVYIYIGIDMYMISKSFMSMPLKY